MVPSFGDFDKLSLQKPFVDSGLNVQMVYYGLAERP